MSDLTPITREETLLDGQDLEPITRKEQFIKRIYDKTQEVPTPITREEWFLKKAGEGGSEVTVEQLNATENGTYSEQGKAYSPVIVEVPEPTLITKSITANGTYSASDDNADGYSSVTVAVEGFKKKSIANTPTDIASFDDGTANPMPSLEISIEPVQSGSGDPSPSNVRPISGWDEVVVTRCGANIGVVKNLYVGGNSGLIIGSDGVMICFNAIKGQTYRLSGDRGDRNGFFEFIGSIDEIVAGASMTDKAVGKELPFTFIADETCVYCYYANSLWSEAIANTIMVSVGESAIDYEPYNGSTTSIPFHDSSDNPITVYGGTLNVTSGELRVTMANIASYNGETINEPWISSMDVYSAGATPTTGAQVVYPLATPQTYQLTPAQVSTLLGQNNIFADCGQILEGEYFVTL